MRADFFLSPVVLVAALVSFHAQRTAPRHALVSSGPATAQLNCESQPAYRVGYSSEPAAILPQGKGFRFQGVAWLTADFCHPGTLTIQAEGEVAGGQAPTLAISLNGESLANFDVPASEKTYTVPIARPGRLTLGYFNDYYLADVRVATLERFKFSGTSCKTIQVDVPAATGGAWRPDYNSASLVSDVPMSVTPCSAGELSLQVVGRKGNGAFPTLRFEQKGQVLQTLTTTQKRQQVKLSLSAAPLTITLTNPYGRTVADRNLNIRSLEFTPAAPTSP